LLTDIISSQVEITDEQWDQIVKVSGLPPEARAHIARAIALYRCMPDYQPSKIRATLKQLSKDTQALCQSLRQLDDNAHAQVVLTITLGSASPDEQLARQRSASIQRELQVLAEWLNAAGDRVVKGRPGARTRAMLTALIVSELDRILEQFTGTNIARSDKADRPGRQYVQAVCKIADPKIGAGSIDAAMKKRISSRGKLRR
jgi:hypothetical protein